MGLDIRMPIGILFALLGGLLTAYGIFAEKAIYTKSLGVNINLWWGVVMLVFGILMVLLGRHATSRVRLAQDSPEGRAIEEREERLGLQKEP
jgi:Mn2+/Fe2+ NRAMP family transporter